MDRLEEERNRVADLYKSEEAFLSSESALNPKPLISKAFYISRKGEEEHPMRLRPPSIKALKVPIPSPTRS